MISCLCPWRDTAHIWAFSGASLFGTQHGVRVMIECMLYRYFIGAVWRRPEFISDDQWTDRLEAELGPLETHGQSERKGERGGREFATKLSTAAIVLSTHLPTYRRCSNLMSSRELRDSMKTLIQTERIQNIASKH